LHINLGDPLIHVSITVTLEITWVIAILIIAVSRTKKQLSTAKAKSLSLHNPQNNVPVAIEHAQVQHLESKKENLRHEPRKQKRKTSGTIAYILLLSGTIALVTSILYSSSILAFIGLGLTFWGALLLFAKPTKYVKASLLDSSALSALTTIDQIITDLNYRGKPMYLPPRYLKALKSGAVFIPLEKDHTIPPVEEAAEGKVFLENPKGMCLTPSGLDLANLYENELGKDFTKVDLDYLQDKLPELFIEDLEIAEDLEINIGDNMIQVKIAGSIFKDFCKEARKLTNVCNSIGCPLCSSIAIALTRATGKPIIIEKTDLSEDNRTIEVYYQMIEE